MTSLRYEIVDVFTDRPFTGNPLAVVLDADDLDKSQMQAIAREFRFSETSFVVTPSEGADYRIRIFTPAEELPFAGHPSVGSAATLVRLGRAEPGELVQECGAGLLPVTATDTAATLTGGEPYLGPELDPAPMLAALGLSDADYVGPPPREAGCGIAFPYLAVRSEALQRITPDATRLRELGDHGISVVAWDAERSTAHCRVFVDGLPDLEDPATGSAALGLGVWLVGSGLLPGQGTSHYTVRQGAELHRPSTLECSVTAQGGTAVRVTVSGRVVAIASGEITVPPFVG